MISRIFIANKTLRWQAMTGLFLGTVLHASAGAAVNCKSDHVTARAFGTEGSAAWGLQTNDTVAMNPFGTVSALDDLGWC